MPTAPGRREPAGLLSEAALRQQLKEDEKKAGTRSLASHAESRWIAAVRRIPLAKPFWTVARGATGCGFRVVMAAAISTQEEMSFEQKEKEARTRSSA